MRDGRQARGASAAAVRLALSAVLLCTGCTIVRDEPQGGSAGAASTGGAGASQDRGFDAAAWTAQVWSSKVLPHFEKDAKDLGKVLDALQRSPDDAGKQYGRRADAEGSPWTFTVRASGKVTSVNAESRAGTAVVSVDAPTGPKEVTLQLGPVVKGTAVRDSLPFFSFGDVTNQIEFAQVARALNARAVDATRKAAEALRVGSRVEFLGAMNVSGDSDEWLVMPVSMKPEAAAP